MANDPQPPRLPQGVVIFGAIMALLALLLTIWLIARLSKLWRF